MPSLQYDRHALHCVLGSVSNNSNSSTLAHVLNHFLCRRTERVVGFVLLWIELKSMSIWMVLDLLNQFTNTRALSLLHNRMWESRNLEVHVHLVQQLFARDLIRHGLQRVARSITNCFVSNVETRAFMKRTCLGTIWHISCVCFNNGLPRSIMCHFNGETLAVNR